MDVNDQQPENSTSTPAPDANTPAQIHEAGNDGVKDWEAEAKKWQHFSKKHEANWKKASEELDRLNQANMTDAERAIADAKEQGRLEALASVTAERVQDKLEAAAAKAGVDLAPLLSHIDISKFAAEDGGVNQTAIGDFVTQLSAQFAGPKEPRFAQGLGIGPQSDQRAPGQLTRADLKRMSAREIAQAKKDGRLDALTRGEI
ncbi:hypothetical protein GCM10022419_016330 [Nonomuraea rosea]|uniref:Scaffolding protein n=1 Tax=Nonomuraea rosea TaxID=638574 RepID=A0ABP6VLL3_9ACTN